MTSSIAVVSMSCRYADARSPLELWENVLAERRAFREIPRARLNVLDYLSSDPSSPDSIYSTQAAVIEGFDFDRMKFRVSGETFRATDMAHWLALDTADKLLSRGEIPSFLPRESTAVFLGNTLTGEFSRANNLRLRLPYVRRVIEPIVCSSLGEQKSSELILQFENAFNEPFPPTSEDSLPGGMSNTIAGRICNHFDLKGGGFTIDGACSSSLLAIANACSALTAGDIDAAVAGGVDLSLDPFELVGFARNGAIAKDEMRVFDLESNGFLPGEGCGFVLLVREEDAVRRGLRIHALVRGWGISSDGSGGLTRPEVGGQILALQRAYRRAGFDIGTVPYFEAHGTGTAVGDMTELAALSKMRSGSPETRSKALVGSIKPIVGHTKAAAGVAGFIKGVMAVENQILPPTTGCTLPLELIAGQGSVLRSTQRAESWPQDEALRAGISSFGFGGINVHVVVESHVTSSRSTSNLDYMSLASSAQDSELFLFASSSKDDLLKQVSHVAGFADRVSQAELGDLAATLSEALKNETYRAAVVCSSPKELKAKLDLLCEKIRKSEPTFDQDGLHFGVIKAKPAIGFLFSGQGSPLNLDGGIWKRRFECLSDLYPKAACPVEVERPSTEIAQPAIINGSIAGLRILRQFGIEATCGVGHSLGEITALHWAEVLTEQATRDIATVRGWAMAKNPGTERGEMLSVPLGSDELKHFLGNGSAVIACFNGPDLSVVSGAAAAIGRLRTVLRENGIASVRLPVSHAFHSDLVSHTIPAFSDYIDQIEFREQSKVIFSTVSGTRLDPSEDLRGHLIRQITSPVKFFEAVRRAEADGVDMWIEIGTGSMLRDLVGTFTATPTVSIEANGQSLRGLFRTIAASFVVGQSIVPNSIFSGRFTRRFDLDWNPQFFANPCELAPISYLAQHRLGLESEPEPASEPLVDSEKHHTSTLDIVKKAIADRTELPESTIAAEFRMLTDLHLNSISVGQIVANAARALGRTLTTSPISFADSTVLAIAQALDRFALDAGFIGKERDPDGIGPWVRPYTVEWAERPVDRSKVQSDLQHVGEWDFFPTRKSAWVESLRLAFQSVTGNGVVVHLANSGEEDCVTALLAAAKRALETGSGKFVLIQSDLLGAAFARTFSIENPHFRTIVLSVPFEDERAIGWILNEVENSEGEFSEVGFDLHCTRHEPRLRSVPFSSSVEGTTLSAQDVIVATGGGKGITAECVLALARESGARVALIGTSTPEHDPELANNLHRYESYGVEHAYYTSDVTDPNAIQSTLKEIQGRFGDITCLLHAAARNEPTRIEDLTEEKFRRTTSVKVSGARNLLAALDPAKLKYFIAFGSIIARSGFSGESDYGQANEWLRELVREFQIQNPCCRCSTIEWSIWSGVGMGTRLANIDLIESQGIVPIPLEAGVETFLRLLTMDELPNSCVVMGRFPETPTLKLDRPELPLLRFVEEILVFYPGVELICDAELSTIKDPYLEDHAIDGELIFPAVLALEAMAQVASTVTNQTKRPSFRELRFDRPIVADNLGTLRIRITSLVRQDGSVDVSIRSAESDFQVDHFAATCRFDEDISSSRAELKSFHHREKLSNLQPYEKLLFQRGRFQRISNYRHLEPKESVADIDSSPTLPWFDVYSPQTLLLGDPGIRDSAIHSIQACIPHQTLLPIAVEKLWTAGLDQNEHYVAHAKEISCSGGVYSYDVQVFDSDGKVTEEWHGLQLKPMNGFERWGVWDVILLEVYLKRVVPALFSSSDIDVSLVQDAELERRQRSDLALKAVVGSNVRAFRRNDGKPEASDGRSVSVSHLDDISLGVSSFAPVGCDIERVESRDLLSWEGLIGKDGTALAMRVVSETNEDISISATRIWSALECTKKASGAIYPLRSADKLGELGWVAFSTPDYSIATYSTEISYGPIVVALLTKV